MLKVKFFHFTKCGDSDGRRAARWSPTVASKINVFKVGSFLELNTRKAGAVVVSLNCCRSEFRLLLVVHLNLHLCAWTEAVKAEPVVVREARLPVQFKTRRVEPSVATFTDKKVYLLSLGALRCHWIVKVTRGAQTTGYVRDLKLLQLLLSQLACLLFDRRLRRLTLLLSDGRFAY